MPSKWDIRRVSKLVGATVLPKLTVTTPDEVGFADIVDCREIAGQKVTRFQVPTVIAIISSRKVKVTRCEKPNYFSYFIP